MPGRFTPSLTSTTSGSRQLPWSAGRALDTSTHSRTSWPGSRTSGRWATELVEIATPHSDPLADLLARTRRPGDPTLRGLTSRSERLCDLLREVDTAALDFARRIERAENNTAQRRLVAQTTSQRRAAAARAELNQLGVPIQ